MIKNQKSLIKRLLQIKQNIQGFKKQKNKKNKNKKQKQKQNALPAIVKLILTKGLPKDLINKYSILKGAK